MQYILTSGVGSAILCVAEQLNNVVEVRVTPCADKFVAMADKQECGLLRRHDRTIVVPDGIPNNRRPRVTGRRLSRLEDWKVCRTMVFVRLLLCTAEYFERHG